MITRRALPCLALSALALVALPSSARSTGYPVFDGSNFAQALLQVRQAYVSHAQDLKTYAGDLQRYKELLTQTQQQAQNLLKAPLSLVSEIDAVYQDYGQLMEQARGLSNQVGQVRAQFQVLYNGAHTGPATEAILAKVRQMARHQRDANEYAAQQQAIKEATARTQRQLKVALDAVKAAEGNLQVQQSAAQLQAVIATQHQQMINLQAAAMRAETTYRAQEATLREMQQSEADRLMQDFDQCLSCDKASKTLLWPHTSSGRR